MKTIRALRVACLLAVSLIAACGSSQVGGKSSSTGEFAPGAPAPGGPAVICGTTLAAATGKPLAGVRVVTPDGVEALSDAAGHFEIRGLALGTTGELVATTTDGRRGSNWLRPLKSGALEVVVFVH